MPVAVRGPLSRDRNQDANYEMLTTWMAAAVAAMWEVFGGPFFSGEHEFTSGKHSLEGCASSLCLCCHRSSIALPWRHAPSLCLPTPPPTIPFFPERTVMKALLAGIKSLLAATTRSDSPPSCCAAADAATADGREAGGGSGCGSTRRRLRVSSKVRTRTRTS